MKLVITDYYHGNSQWQCFIASQNQECHCTCLWMTSIVRDDKFHEMPPVIVIVIHCTGCGSLFRRFVNPKVRYSEGSLIRKWNRVRYFEGALIRKWNRVRYSENEIRFVNPKMKYIPHPPPHPFGFSPEIFNFRINEPYFIFGITNFRNNEPYFIFGLTNLRNNEPYLIFGLTNLRNNEPYFIFGLTNLISFSDQRTFGITNPISFSD